MNNLTPLARSVCLACALGSVLALTPAAAQNAPAGTEIRSADFIVAIVNNEPITNSEVRAQRTRLLRDMQVRGDEVSAAELSRAALEQLIVEKAQVLEAKDSGIKIDDPTVEQAVQNMANNNQISREELLRRLAQDGISPETFREQLRQQLMITRLREREVESRVRISDLDIEQYLRDQVGASAVQAPEEIQLGMLLVAVPENSPPEQLERLSARAADLARRARQGENFAQLAKSASDAPDAASTGGDMGLRSADRYPELFVDAVRQLKPGEVSAPVRSGAGFHVLKLIERRQGAAGTLMVTQSRARHILLRPGPQLSQAQALAQLSELRQQILAGRTGFADAARERSQDGSAAQGGDLGWSQPGQFVPEFEQALARLSPGQISEPLVSRFGVHLIELVERRQAPVNLQEQRDMARGLLREKKLDESFNTWMVEIRARAYVEMREPPQ
jgi:peptidyl-prolyl cis-trans isomerase SurA